MTAVWYVRRGENSQGPYSLSDLNDLTRAGFLKKEDFVRSEQMKDWVKASDLPGLAFPAAVTDFDEPPPLSSRKEDSSEIISASEKISIGRASLPPIISKPKQGLPREQTQSRKYSKAVPVIIGLLIISILCGVAWLDIRNNPARYSFLDPFLPESVMLSPRITAISIEPQELAMVLGDEKYQLNALIEPESRSNAALVWLTSNPAVATVDSSGKVDAIGIGVAQITVEVVDGKDMASCTVTVEDLLEEAVDHGIEIIGPISWKVHIWDGTYKGELKNGSIPHGQGVWNHSGGTKYEGEWQDGNRHGHGTMIWGSDTQWAGDQYVGEFSNGMRHGQGTYHYASGKVYKGEYVDGKYHGWGSLTWPNGDSYTGGFSDGKQHGQGTYTSADGWKYEGSYVDEQRSGQGYIVYKSGNTYTGEWKDNQPNGWGTFTWPDGSKFVGTMKDGKVVQGTGTDRQGNKYVGSFNTNGESHGQGTYTYADGRVVSGRWDNGNYLGP